MYVTLIFLSILLLSKTTNSSNILAVALVPSYSHQIFYRPIWLELARRGHQITLMTTDPMDNPSRNIKQIDWFYAYDIRHKKHDITKVLQENEYNFPKILDLYQSLCNEMVEEELSHPEVKLLLKNETEHFDLLIAEYFSPVVFGFAERFKCPYITISSLEIANSYYHILGIPIHPVMYPEVLMPFERNLNFKERFVSTLFFLYSFYRYSIYGYEKEEAIARNHFGEDLPPLDAIVRNVSMVFVNTNPVFNTRPLGPGVVRIGGGMHLAEKKELPEDIGAFLNSTDHGAIYFSLGTNVRSHHLHVDFLKAAIETFKELPYKILWKLDTELPQKSANVKVVKWAPQQDVLRHKNIKLFITQCGAQSMEEAIFSGVPMLTIPFVSDQKMNAHKVAENGLGLVIDKNTITKAILKAQIMKMMTNPSFKKRVDKTAQLLADEPMSGLDKAIWWTEYVIRHKGAKHFWHSNKNLPIYQYLLLDVLSAIFSIISLLIYIIYKICLIFWKRLIEKSYSKEKTA